MSFVPVTGPATFRAADPPREGVVEFSDERRTLALPMRAALPVLARALRRPGEEEVHPSVGLLAGAALLGMQLVAAGKFEPAGGAPHWRATLLDGPDTDRITRLAGSRHAARPRRPPRPSSWCATCSSPWSTRCPAAPRPLQPR